jgi:hypothetical protein
MGGTYQGDGNFNTILGGNSYYQNRYNSFNPQEQQAFNNKFKNTRIEPGKEMQFESQYAKSLQNSQISPNPSTLNTPTQQQQTDYNNSLASAQSQAQKGQQMAQQQIAGYNTNQQQSDQMSKKSYSSGSESVGQQLTGKSPMLDIYKPQPTQKANVTGGNSNQFTLPSSSGIKIGGS